jgi:hypothetical protein
MVLKSLPQSRVKYGDQRGYGVCVYESALAAELLISKYMTFLVSYLSEL